MGLVVGRRYKPSNTLTHEIIRYRIREIEKHLPRDPLVYYVTDLVKCRMKREFELNHPQLLYIRATVGRTFLGETVHRGIEAILKEIYGDNVHVEYEGDLEKSKEITVDGVTYTVKGRIDAILGNNTGIEIKETISQNSLPFQHHVEQCMIYNWLYGFDKTILLYITSTGIYEFEVHEAYTDNDIARLIRDTRSPRWDWECNICEFAPICPIARTIKRKQ